MLTWIILFSRRQLVQTLISYLTLSHRLFSRSKLERQNHRVFNAPRPFADCIENSEQLNRFKAIVQRRLLQLRMLIAHRARIQIAPKDGLPK
jgi:hypothetical protein